MTSRVNKLQHQVVTLHKQLDEERERSRLTLERAMAYYQNGPKIGTVHMLHDGQLHALQIFDAGIIGGAVHLTVLSPFPGRPT